MELVLLTPVSLGHHPINVIEFVRLAEIDPVFYERPYHLEPQKQGAHAYILLREANGYVPNHNLFY